MKKVSRIFLLIGGIIDIVVSVLVALFLWPTLIFGGLISFGILGLLLIPVIPWTIWVFVTGYTALKTRTHEKLRWRIIGLILSIFTLFDLAGIIGNALDLIYRIKHRKDNVVYEDAGEVVEEGEGFPHGSGEEL